jgi:hypothetical protein
MLQKITISAFFILSFLVKLNAQATWTYAGGNGSTGAEVSRGVCTDAAGNIYVIGQFSNTVDLDYGAGTANVTSAGSNDIFIASYTSAGAYRWSLRAGNTTNDNGVSICTNGTDVYAYGFYATSATFGSTTLSSSGVSDAFLVKLNASTGAVTWAVTHGGSASDTPAAMCLDATGNIYTIESYNTSWSACSAYTSIGSSDLLIQKINPTNGACIWAATGGSTSGDGGSGSGICYVPASNKIVVSTEFSGPLATFGAFSLTNVNGGSVQTDMAVIELDASTGNFMSAISFGTATGDDASSCVYDPSTGDVFISGGFPSNVTLPNGGPGITLTTAGANDIWLGRYSPVNHYFVWAKSAGGTLGDINQERSYGVTSDGAGTIAISGSHLSNPTNFGSLSLANTSGFGQIFVAGYKALDGNELWVNNAITNAPALQSVGRGITTNSNTGVYWITGTFCTTTTFGAQPSITSAGFADLFNAKFTAPVLVTCTTPSLTLSSQTNVLCNGGSTGSATVSATGGAPYTYTWSPSGGNAATAAGLSAGVYTCVTTNSCGLTASRTVTITQPATALSASNSVTNVLCRSAATGAINLTPAGGTSPYTFNWGAGITTEDRTGLIAGAYTCTITDNNGCTTTSNATITQPASALSASNVVTNISCFAGSNGAINLTPAGGTAGYTFNWGGGVTTEDRTGLLAGAYTCTITDANGCTTTSNATITQPATALSASNVVTNILCRGAATGAINLTATGGTGAYTYNWGGGITTEDRTGLLAGAYTCTITDANGCTTTSNATVTQPATALSASNVVTNISCFGGSNGAINLTPAGGTGAYTFLWSTGHTTEDRTGLLAGAYTCTITDANGCTTTSNATVTQPASALSASNVVTNISCFGGSNGAINLTPAGGTTAYTFLWSTGHTTEDRTGLLAGAYTCTITDANGCTTTSNATVTQPASALSASNVVTNISCFGGSNGAINLTPAGGTGAYTFLWSTGHTTEDRTGLLAGAYTCTITDANGCTTTSNATVTQPASALATSTTVTNISCNGGSNGSATVTATGGTGTYTYLWSSAQTSSVITGQIAGVRTVTVTDANGCTSSKSISIAQPASALSASNVVTNISCFGGSNGAINLTPVGGTTAYTFNWGGGITTEDRTGLLAGAYTCTITDANGCTTTSNATVTQPASALATSTAVTNIYCNGGSNGSATVTASGGTSPYTYLWSSAQTTSVITSQIAGVRTVTVTDANGCTSSKSISIIQPATALSASNVVTNISCFGGSNGAINLTPAGGTTAYTFNWGGGITTEDRTGLLAGAYTCTITDANGCTTTSNATVTQPASALAATISSTNTACLSNTGIASVSASGGTPSYTYSWSPSGGTGSTASSLGVGNYSCVIMDANSCSITRTVNIITSGAPTATIIAQTNVTCNSLCNGSATVSASGGTTPYNYIWSNGNSTTIATNICAGVITCTIIGSNGCSTVVNTTITQPTVLSANATALAILCNGGVSTVTVSATGGTSSYAGVGTFTTLAGTKSYTVTDANGCSTTTSISITQPSVLSANSSASSILCNGGISTITVSATGGTASYLGIGTFTTLAGTKSYTVTDANGCSTTTSISVSEPSILSANSSASSILCNNGVSTITVTVTGGTPSYVGTGTFIANAGSQTYTVTDANGCSTTTSVSITEPTVLSANTVASSIICNGGVSTITVSATGGMSSYLGVGTFTANAGTHTYTVTDANGCSTTSSISIAEPLALISSQNVTVCAGQSISVGTSTYNASGTYTNVLAGINGCDSTITTNLIVNPAIVSSQTITLCSGQSLTVGSNTYTTTGIYTNTFIAVNGCDSTLTTDLTINSAIVSSQTITLCSGQSLVVGANTYTATGVYTNTFTSVSGCDSTVTTNLTINNVIDVTTSLSGLTITANETSASYQWIDCDNSNAIIPSETNQNFTASANGNYAVIVTQNSCSDTSACVNISTVGIKEVNSLTGIKLYPNPTNSSFTISGVELNTTITIYNAIGVLVKSIKSSDNTIIDLSDYSNGIYFIKMQNTNGEAIHKLIKQ